MTTEAELRRRFGLEGSTAQERPAQERPDVAKAAAELHKLSVRFSLGLDYAACVRMVKEQLHESVE